MYKNGGFREEVFVESVCRDERENTSKIPSN